MSAEKQTSDEQFFAARSEGYAYSPDHKDDHERLGTWARVAIGTVA
jgi:hypothetical protein